MLVLVFNCGSSSLKYRLVAMPDERTVADGEAQRIGPRTAEPSRIAHRRNGETETVTVEMADHAAAFVEVMRLLQRDGVQAPDVIGHRVVHGGARFTDATLFDERVDQALSEVADLAPIHNPPAIELVRSCRQRTPELPQVLVFDTSYHCTIPECARTYALPAQLREGLGLRKYGFHGISHQFVAQQAATLLSVPWPLLHAVSCHLGSGGASLCAIVRGRSIDNTMGYSPLQGLLMSTRCGDLDPAVTLALIARQGGDADAVEQMLNRRSGVLGLSGYSADIRDVAARAAGHGELDPAYEVYLWRIRKYLGAYLTVTAPAHAVIFTDTIGESVSQVRSAVCAGLTPFGVQLDEALNADPPPLPCDVAAAASPIRVLVIPTNEELAIARCARRLLSSEGRIQAQEMVS